jgi:rfaE bifunctional protein kinase chain/domain
MILVTGDAMVDRYWFGTVARVSPEAPVAVLGYERAEERAGGAANVAANCAAMGAKVRELYSPDWPARPVVKLRLIGRTQQIARVDFDVPQAPVDLGALAEAAHGCRVAVLSDYAKGAIADPFSAITACRMAGAQVVVDPKGCDANRYRGTDVLKPNHHEMIALVGEWEAEVELEDLAFALCRAFEIGAVLMTRGDRGMSLFVPGFETLHLAGRKLELCDVSGAGDTAIAALAVGMDRGMPLAAAAMLANHAAGVAVSRFGTSVVRAEELATAA